MFKPRDIPQVCWRVEEGNRALSYSLIGIPKEPGTLSVGISSLKPQPPVNHLVGRGKLWKSTNLPYPDSELISAQQETTCGSGSCINQAIHKIWA
jgi:hypothetical protein